MLAVPVVIALNISITTLAKGPFAVQVVNNAKNVAGLQEQVRALAKQQYDKLPGGTTA
jgi:hypothetical protein